MHSFLKKLIRVVKSLVKILKYLYWTAVESSLALQLHYTQWFLIFRVDSGSVDLETPLELSPKSPLEALDDALNVVMPNGGTMNCISQPTPPPRNKQMSKGQLEICHVVL